MSTQSSDLPSLLRAHVELQGASLTAEELSRLEECYPRFRGKEPWDVRQYAGATGNGAREYRVVRGSSTQDVYRTHERHHATAVQTALNELEAQNGGTQKGEQPAN